MNKDNGIPCFCFKFLEGSTAGATPDSLAAFDAESERIMKLYYMAPISNKIQ
jgi:hypothetical protein